MNRAMAFLGVAAFSAAISVISAVPAYADDFSICPSGMTGVATDDTSCAFAENVRAALGTQPGAAVMAYSPATQQSYAMQCAPAATNTWPSAQRCVGANSYGVGLIVFVATPAVGSGSGSQSAIGQEQLTGSGASAGVGADSPNIPSATTPNIGCTWVNGYTKRNGTHVSGYWRC